MNVTGIVLLGLLGFDPLGGLLALAALAQGAKPRVVTSLLAAYLVSIAALGVGVTLAARQGLLILEGTRGLVSSRGAGSVELILAGLLVGYLAVRRLRRAPQPRQQPGESRWRRAPGVLAGVVAGVVVAVTLCIDPGFVLMVVAVRDAAPLTWPAAFLLWGAESQCLLVLVWVGCAVIPSSPVDRLAQAMASWWTRAPA